MEHVLNLPLSKGKTRTTWHPYAKLAIVCRSEIEYEFHSPRALEKLVEAV